MIPFRSSALPVALVTAAAASGCGGGADAPQERRLPPGTPERLEAEPILSVGSAPGDTLQELYRVVTPFLDPGGRLVVPLANTIRVFGPDGTFLESLGRPGQGPGEFQLVSAAWSRGDTLEAFDGDQRRITRFRPDGSVDVVTLNRTIPVQGAVPGTVPDGWILDRVARTEEERSAASRASHRDDIVVHHVALDGSHLGEVTRTLGIARYQAPHWSGPEPLGPRAILRLHDGRLYVGETLTPRIRVLDPSGAPRRELSWDPGASPDIEATVRRVIDTAVARAPRGQEEATRTRYEAAPMPERLSVWWDFLVDAEGFVWIRPWEPLRHAVALGGLGQTSYLLGASGQGGRWTILSPEGERVGEIALPADLNPVWIGEDALVGLRRDPLGVESVHVYRLVRH